MNTPSGIGFCTATEILGWLERNAESIFIQAIPPGRRPKNRAVIQFRDGGEVKAVGGVTIAAAVQRARSRQQAASAAKE